MFHEVLGLMKLEKNSYAISNRLFRAGDKFAVKVFYDCEGGCKISLRYDFMQRALVMNNSYCAYFDTQTKFFRGSGSDNSFYWDTDGTESGDHFRKLSLMDGDNIYFEGELYPRWPKRLFCFKKH